MIGRVLWPLRMAALTTLGLAMAGSSLWAAEAGNPVATGRPAGEFSWSVGAGGIVQPAYQGARRTDWSAMPYFSAEIGSALAVDSLDGVRVRLWNDGNLSFGAIARYRPGRSSRSLPVRLRGLNGLPDGADLGGFAGFDSGLFSLDVIGAKEVGGGRGGLVAEAHAAVSLPLGNPADQQGLAVGPFVRAANRTSLQRVFGVDAGQATGTGLAAFTPHPGLAVAGLEASGAISLGGRWSARGVTNWGRLLGGAADSPLVRQGGGASQFSGGLFLVFTP